MYVYTFKSKNIYYVCIVWQENIQNIDLGCDNQMTRTEKYISEYTQNVFIPFTLFK